MIDTTHHYRGNQPTRKEDMNKRYLFVIADRKFAKILTFYDGVLEEYTEISDSSVPQKVKANHEEVMHADRSNKIARHIEDHLRRHLILISGKIDEFVGVKPIDAVFIGGHKNMFHLIRKHLNPKLQKKIVGEFVAGLKVFQNETLRRCEKAVLQFEQSLA